LVKWRVPLNYSLQSSERQTGFDPETKSLEGVGWNPRFADEVYLIVALGEVYMWDLLVTWMKALFGGKDHPRSAPLNPSAAKPPETTSPEDLAVQAENKHRLDKSTRIAAESERKDHANQASFQFEILLNILKEHVKRYNQRLSGQDGSELAMALTQHSENDFEIKSGFRSVRFHLSYGRLQVSLQNGDAETFTLEQGRWMKKRTVRYAGGEFQPDRLDESKRFFENQMIAGVYLRYLAGIINQVLTEFSV
jgi:hypothetical protein